MEKPKNANTELFSQGAPLSEDGAKVIWTEEQKSEIVDRFRKTSFQAWLSFWYWIAVFHFEVISDTLVFGVHLEHEHLVLGSSNDGDPEPLFLVSHDMATQIELCDLSNLLSNLFLESCGHIQLIENQAMNLTLH